MTLQTEPTLFPPKSARPMEPAELARSMLDWYDKHRRVLPWRALPGKTADPYRVWLSEIMLQQTTVATVGPYFEEFLRRWPTVADLAAADLDAVLHAWAGLGYYARARNLHKCAKTVAEQHGGVFPDNEEQLRQLPGIGAYTAAAVAAIAFDRRATVLDGNVERVMARLFSRGGTAAGGQAEAPRAGGYHHAGSPSRRLRPGGDGLGRHRLHSAPAPLRASAPGMTAAPRGRRESRRPCRARPPRRRSRCGGAWRSG